MEPNSQNIVIPLKRFYKLFWFKINDHHRKTKMAIKKNTFTHTFKITLIKVAIYNTIFNQITWGKALKSHHSIKWPYFFLSFICKLF